MIPATAAAMSRRTRPQPGRHSRGDAGLAVSGKPFAYLNQKLANRRELTGKHSAVLTGVGIHAFILSRKAAGKIQRIFYSVLFFTV